MTKEEIRNLLSPILDVETSELDLPSESDWATLEAQFGTRFPSEFKAFIELMTEFCFPGDILNVPSGGRTNGNDSIPAIYARELAASDWPKHLVPFYGIGNGDYFALGVDDGAVYYRYHEDRRAEKYEDSFEGWLRRLPAFLEGES